jgi:hypothetical protein
VGVRVTAHQRRQMKYLVLCPHCGRLVPAELKAVVRSLVIRLIIQTI